MDSKELMICESPKGHLSYVGYHQLLRDSHRDAQYPRFNRRRQMFCHGPRVKMAHWDQMSSLDIISIK